MADGPAVTAATAVPVNMRGQKLEEIEVPIGETVVTGSKTIQVDIKE